MHDWLQLFHGGHTTFPLTDIAVKAIVAISIGLLVGFEREWANKDIGVRTFALTSLLGLLASLVDPRFGLLAGASVLLLIVFLNFHSVQLAHKLEATTSVALIVVFMLGVLVGNGHLFTPIACAIVVTLLLSLKTQFHAFAGGLRQEEVKSAILLGLLGFVIWPLLPNRFVDPWGLLDPREAWIIVIVVASLGFINYVLLRVYGSKGIYPTAILGGLVNSTATVAEMASTLPATGLTKAIVPVVLLISIAMISRNLLILAIFSPHSIRSALLPLLAMAFIAAGWAYSERKKSKDVQMDGKLPLASPVSLKKVLTFAALFLAIQIVGTIAQRAFGSAGLQVISVLGGLVSSAGTTAAAADLALHGKILASAAGSATVLTSIASLLVDLLIVSRQVRDKSVIRDLSIASLLQVAAGIAVLIVQTKVFHL
ncbi:MAG: DUF4010 domain-containing protein [Acidobacteriaceae bacterium]